MFRSFLDPSSGDDNVPSPHHFPTPMDEDTDPPIATTSGAHLCHEDNHQNDDHDEHQPDQDDDDQRNPTGYGGADDPDDLYDNLPQAVLPDLQFSQENIECIRNAELKDDILDAEIREQLTSSPLRDIDPIEPGDRASIELFEALSDCSQAVYARVRDIFMKYNPDLKILSYPATKTRIQQITGVIKLTYDMCPDGCMAYVSADADRETCRDTTCGLSRWDPIKLAKGEKFHAGWFYVFPLGPQLQAAYRSPGTARMLRYGARVTQEVLTEIRNNKEIGIYRDVYHGSDYISSFSEGKIGPYDTILNFSLDGAQLYRDKESDCWYLIFVNLSLPPETRYKKEHIIVAAIIPGPKKPKRVDTFVIPIFRHTAAIQKEGLAIWDGYTRTQFVDRPFVLYKTADTLAIIIMTGHVGHGGRQGCRVFCGMPGRRKPGASMYYPVTLLPENYTVQNCTHEDVDLRAFASSGPDTTLYMQQLHKVLSSTTNAAYERHRLETGIVRPSPVLGLPEDHRLPVPRNFPLDLMHLAGLNLPELLINIWTGELRSSSARTKEDSEHAYLVGDAWTEHGELIASTRPFLPSSFGRAPRNPALKINSGYKAWEYMIYIWSIGPAVFRPYLPDEIWEHFCKLVYGMRIIQQREISLPQLLAAHEALISWVEEFEQIYYARDPNAMHLVRPCVHSVGHLAPETFRCGPLSLIAQWAMENLIGNLGREVHLLSNPFANLGERAMLRAQLNALKGLFPDLAPKSSKSNPRGSIPLGKEYLLIFPRAESPYTPPACDEHAIRAYLHRTPSITPTDEFSVTQITRWGCLRLPNGQRVRTKWREGERSQQKGRLSRNTKVNFVNFLHL